MKRESNDDDGGEPHFHPHYHHDHRVPFAPKTDRVARSGEVSCHDIVLYDGTVTMVFVTG